MISNMLFGGVDVDTWARYNSWYFHSSFEKRFEHFYFFIFVCCRIMRYGQSNTLTSLKFYEYSHASSLLPMCGGFSAFF